MQIEGFSAVYPIANDDHSRSTAEKTSLAHFLRFEFTDEMIEAANAGAKWALKSELLNIQYSTEPLDQATAKSLLQDFS
jgi:hypothetical protein